MPIQLFPLTGGMQQGFDVRLLPDGVLANAVNCELERVGRVVGRAKYTALATGVLSSGAGALVAYDLATYQGRLFAFGDDTRFGCPANLYEYLGAGVAQPWRPTSPVSDLVPRLGLATRVRDIARPPDQGFSAAHFGGAVLAGFAALAWDTLTRGYLFVVRAADDQAVLFVQMSSSGNQPIERLRVIALSDRFLIVGRNSGLDKISISKYAPATDTVVASLVTDIFSSAAITASFGVCKVTGSDQIVIAARVSTTIKVRRYDNTGSVIVPSGGQYADIAGTSTSGFRLTVEASATANQVNVAFIDLGACSVYSYNLATGADIGVGPFSPFAGDTCTDVTLVRDSATTIQVVVSVTSGTAPEIKVNRYTASTNTFAGKITAVTDAQLTTQAAFHSATGALLFGVRVGLGTVGNSPNILCSWLLTDKGSRLEIVKDFEAAGVSVITDLVFDSSTSRWYWANASADPDASLAPRLTEFAYGSTERRQTAEFGGHLYVGGGAPMVFDGVSVVESGFFERPRIISLTPQNQANNLLAGATYSYREHWEWVDSKGDLHLSPPSTISTVTLGANDDTVDAIGTSPHSARRNVGAQPGSAVACVFSRTLATVTNTAAVIIGERSIDPPDSTLSTLTLVVKAGGTTWTVTFTVAATTAAQIVTEINATVNTLKLLASAPNGVLVLTSVATGDTASVQVISGTGLTLLGLTAGDLSQGTTERSVGENFQRAKVGNAELSDAVAAYVEADDTRKDESDPIVDSDLIRQQVLYSQGIASGAHHAPPPSDCVWAGKERLGFFRQYTRSRWTVSKLIVPGEPAECASEGFPAFSGRVGDDIEAGAFVGGALVLWTRKQICLVTGEGPRRNGVGEFNQAECITRSIGMIADGWMSQVQDDEGVWFQGSDGELYRISNGGQLEWLGKPVREYLQTYPKIVGAVYRQSKREVAFAVTTANGSSGGILRRNALVPDSPGWFFDDVGAVSSIAEYQGRLCYVQAGIVYLQDASPGSGAFPTMQLDSGLFQGFQALGYGALQELGVLATFRGRCTITLKIGTDGVTFPDTIAAWSLTASEYAVGQRVQLLIDAPKQEFDSFAIRAEVSDVTGTTEGAWLHAFAVKTESKPDFVRLAPSRRL